MSRSSEDRRFWKGLRCLMLGAAQSAVWPTYLLLLAYMARQAPWSRSMSVLACAILVGLSLALFVHDLLKWLARPSGWAESYLGLPARVARQLARAGRFLTVMAAVLVLPAYLIDNGLIIPEGRLLTAPSCSRLLVLTFEVAVWGVAVRLLTGRSALLASLAMDPDGSDAQSMAAAGGSRVLAGLLWISRRRHFAALLPLAAVGAVIVLDVRGYSFSARRLAVAGSQTAAVIAVCAAAYRAVVRTIDGHVGTWTRSHRRRSWALALTAAMARRAAARSRRAAASAGQLADPADNTDPAQSAPRPEDLATGLRRLAGGAIIAMGFLAVAWLWDLDLAFVRFLLNQSLWSVDQTPVTVGDLAEAGATVLAGVLAWRYMSAFFALTLFHRMPDDPGVRFAVVMLCRYAVVAVTTVAALGAVRLDMARISVILAALGVGLGFGLQEIISNFVCGIILLLERPIRIGDIVTVADTTGRVDRILIRATTIINGDNQCMIVPNREFITGKLVNWTHKDKILRITIKLVVAYGTDPEQVVDLLMSVARRDQDVVMSPAPSAMMEGFGDWGLQFALYAFVPEPGLVGTTRHRLCSEIQRRFAEARIVIPLPTHELHVGRLSHDLARALESQPVRRDGGAPAPPEPHVRTTMGIRVGEK